MPFVDATEMLSGEPLPGWRGRFFHSANMTFSIYEIADGAVPLHEHHHPEEEVWHVVEGEIVITIDGVERMLGPGTAAIIPPNTLHSARGNGACRAIIADHPVRTHLPGMKNPG